MILATVDPEGVCGTLLHYSIVIALVGSAFLIFLHLMRKGKLDMDEEPKLQMMLNDDLQEDNHDHRKS